MPKTEKTDDVAEPKVKKTRKTPSKPKVPVANIPRSIGVRQLSDLLHVDSIQVIKQLMRNGVMANINQVIDYDTAAPITLPGLGGVGPT